MHLWGGGAWQLLGSGLCPPGGEDKHCPTENEQATTNWRNRTEYWTDYRSREQRQQIETPTEAQHTGNEYVHNESGWSCAGSPLPETDYQ